MSSGTMKVDRKRIAELVEREEKRLEDATPKSYELFRRASKSLVNGVSSSYQMRDPYPVYFTHGRGSKIYSVDGLELSDFDRGRLAATGKELLEERAAVEGLLGAR